MCFSSLLRGYFRPGEKPPWRVWVIEWGVLEMLDPVAGFAADPRSQNGSLMPGTRASQGRHTAPSTTAQEVTCQGSGGCRSAFGSMVPYWYTPMNSFWDMCLIHHTQHPTEYDKDTATREQRQERLVLLGPLKSDDMSSVSYDPDQLDQNDLEKQTFAWLINLFVVVVFFLPYLVSKMGEL